jgi:hypothetical protein
VYDNAWGKHLKPGVFEGLGVLGKKHEQAEAAAAAGRQDQVGRGWQAGGTGSCCSLEPCQLLEPIKLALCMALPA